MPISELEDIPGLHYLRTEKLFTVEHTYWVAPDADMETVRALLRCVTPTRDLLFVDEGPPHLQGDPEAEFFILFVGHSDGLLAQRGTHRWTSDWIPVSTEEAERYLEMCVLFGVRQHAREVRFSEPADPFRRGKINPAPDSGFRLYLNRRLALGT